MADRKLLANIVWAIMPEWFGRLLAGVELEVLAAKQAKAPAVQGNVAILPIHGVIQHRDSMMLDLFGGTSTQRLAAQYVRAVNDDRIGAIIFDVDSPGGMVSGTPEAAAIIREGSARKPTFACAQGDMCSAAYYLASQVGPGHLMASPSSRVGSIGVYAEHYDWSEAMANAGVKPTVMAIPEYKAEFTESAPLTDDAKEFWRSHIETAYEQFVSDVAAGRQTKASTVKADYGKGRFFWSEAAKERGMIDRVGTIGELFAELTRTKGVKASAAASQEIAAEIAAAGERPMEAFKSGTSLDLHARRLALAERA